MKSQPNAPFLAFAGTTLIASGGLEEVAKAVKSVTNPGVGMNILVFNSVTSKLVDLDLRGTEEEVVDRYKSPPSATEDKKSGPGRPKLGVVPREVTLLPRHWEWLASQPGGASTTLRRLVEEARKNSGATERIRQSQTATYEFMRVLAGDLAGYEDALRALYAGQKDRFIRLVAGWPSDVSAHVLRLAEPAFVAATTDLQRFLPHAQFGDVNKIEPITIGRSGAAVYSVSTATGDFILRIQGENRSTWDVAVRLQRLASDSQIAPRIVYVDETARATVSVKVSGESFGVAISRPASRSATFAGLVQALQKLHSMSAPHLPALDPVEFARSVWNEQAVRPGFPRWAAPLGERISDLDRIIKPDTRKVLSHCDLNPANIIWDGRQVWLVDWDGAGLAHPYLDLATIANFLTLPNEAALSLLAQQERAPIADHQKAVFSALRELSSIVYGCVFLRLVPDLATVTFRSRLETPALGQCFAMLASGEYSASDPQWLAWVAGAMFKQCDAA